MLLYIWTEIQNISFMKMHLKILSAKGQPFCSGRGELKSSTNLAHNSFICNDCIYNIWRDESSLLCTSTVAPASFCMNWSSCSTICFTTDPGMKHINGWTHIEPRQRFKIIDFLWVPGTHGPWFVWVRLVTEHIGITTVVSPIVKHIEIEHSAKFAAKTNSRTSVFHYVHCNK